MALPSRILYASERERNSKQVENKQREVGYVIVGLFQVVRKGLCEEMAFGSRPE